MAVARMAKVMIVSHRTQASELLEALQSEGICQILNAKDALVSKELPEAVAPVEKPRDIQHLLEHLEESIAFLKRYAESPKGLAAVLSPRTVVSEHAYRKVVSSAEIQEVVEQCRKCEAEIEKLKAECENIIGVLEQLRPWVLLETPVEEIGQLQRTTALAGLIPARQVEQLKKQLSELGSEIEFVGTFGNRYACIIACLNWDLNNLHKLLRSVDFEAVSFEDMTGTTAELIKRNKEKLEEIENQLKAEQNKALSLSDNLLKLEILYDHYVNLLNRERTRGSAPATEQTVILEGWVRESDFHHLEKIVSKFEASSLVRIAPAEGEEVPVEIENKAMVRPFEVITRLYGMPNRTSVDPTIFLAPFFAVFFGLCLADVAYGLIMIALLTWIMRKMQGDKLIMWMLAICGVTTFSAGVLTGSWFSDALQQFEFLAFLRPVREYLMLFDPMKEPMRFFVLSLVLGYLQIQFGLFIALINNLLKKDIVSALCDQLTWIVLLNCLLGLGLSKAGILAADASKVFGFFAIAAAAGILFFSGHAEGWSVGRFGLGVFNLFSTVFFAGDILSYVRLMALGMVGSGFGMAVNVLVKLVMGVPYVGWILGAVVFVGGHLFNLALSMLGAFVHSLRLQFVEFFPKFLVGGGRDFLPFRKDYRYISIESKNFKTAKIVS